MKIRRKLVSNLNIDNEVVLNSNVCNELKIKILKKIGNGIPLNDFMKLESISEFDKFIFAIKSKLLSDCILRSFACDCAERACNHRSKAGLKNDRRILYAIQIARDYLNRKADRDTLAMAMLHASDAAWDASAMSFSDIAYDAAVSCASGSATSSAIATAKIAAGIGCRYEEAPIHNGKYCRYIKPYVNTSIERTWQFNHLKEIIERIASIKIDLSYLKKLGER